MNRSNVIIRMGATKFTVDVRGKDGFIQFDMNKMNKKDQHTFCKELCIAFREASL